VAFLKSPFLIDGDIAGKKPKAERHNKAYAVLRGSKKKRSKMTSFPVCYHLPCKVVTG